MKGIPAPIHSAPPRRKTIEGRWIEETPPCKQLG